MKPSQSMWLALATILLISCAQSDSGGSQRGLLDEPTDVRTITTSPEAMKTPDASVQPSRGQIQLEEQKRAIVEWNARFQTTFDDFEKAHQSMNYSSMVSNALDYHSNWKQKRLEWLDLYYSLQEIDSANNLRSIIHYSIISKDAEYDQLKTRLWQESNRQAYKFEILVAALNKINSDPIIFIELPKISDYHKESQPVATSQPASSTVSSPNVAPSSKSDFKTVGDALQKGDIAVKLETISLCPIEFNPYQEKWLERLLNERGNTLPMAEKIKIQDALVFRYTNKWTSGMTNEEYLDFRKREQAAADYVKAQSQFIKSDICVKFSVDSKLGVYDSAFFGFGYNQDLKDGLIQVPESIAYASLTKETYFTKIIRIKPPEKYDSIHVVLYYDDGSGLLQCHTKMTTSCNPRDEIQRDNVFTFKVDRYQI